jgi:hypothetical protein
MPNYERLGPREDFEGLWFPEGWRQFFERPDYEENRYDFNELLAATYDMSSEDWVIDNDELKRRWIAAIERAALVAISKEDRAGMTELETVELTVSLVKAVALDAGAWEKEGVAFAVFNAALFDAEDPPEVDIKAGVVIDLRDL